MNEPSLTNASLENMLTSITSGPDSILAKLVATGNTQSVIQICEVVTVLLNNKQIKEKTLKNNSFLPSQGEIEGNLTVRRRKDEINNKRKDVSIITECRWKIKCILFCFTLLYFAYFVRL